MFCLPWAGWCFVRMLLGCPPFEVWSLLCGEIPQLRMARVGRVVRFGLVSNSPNYSH